MDTQECIQVFCAVNHSTPSYKALERAVRYCQSLNLPYLLIIAHFIGLNPKQTLPYLDHLEKAYNLEIQEKEEKELQDIALHLEQFNGKVNYKFIKVEGSGEVGPLIEEYISKNFDNHLEMVFVGTRNNGALKRWVLGSVSEYLIHHLTVPVCVVKDV